MITLVGWLILIGIGGPSFLLMIYLSSDPFVKWKILHILGKPYEQQIPESIRREQKEVDEHRRREIELHEHLIRVEMEYRLLHLSSR
jgi:hypothetical protein